MVAELDYVLEKVLVDFGKLFQRSRIAGLALLLVDSLSSPRLSPILEKGVRLRRSVSVEQPAY